MFVVSFSSGESRERKVDFKGVYGFEFLDFIVYRMWNRKMEEMIFFKFICYGIFLLNIFINI